MIFPENPFHPGTPSRPNSFVGRTALIEQLNTALARRDQALVSIFGQRRIGKTSLLWRLEGEWRQRGGIQVLAFDGLQMQANPPDKWLSDLVNLIENPDEVSPSKLSSEEHGSPTNWDRLENLLSCIDRRVLLLIDEFDALSGQGAERFDGSFFASFRSCLTSQGALGKMTLVTATQQDLDASTWSHEMGPGSPFANISGLQAKVGFLSEGEAMDLLVRGRELLAPDELNYLYRLAGPHPHFLQVAGFAAWSVKEEHKSEFEEIVQGRFVADSYPVYRSILRNLSDDAREDLYLRAVLGKGSIERERRLQDDLLVNSKGEIYSDGLRLYCLRDGGTLTYFLRRHFKKLPKSLRFLLREHCYSSGQEIPEDRGGFILRELGWLDDKYQVPRSVRQRATQIMEEDEDA